MLSMALKAHNFGIEQGVLDPPQVSFAKLWGQFTTLSLRLHFDSVGIYQLALGGNGFVATATTASVRP